MRSRRSLRASAAASTPLHDRDDSPQTSTSTILAELLSEVIIGGTGSLTGSIIGAAFLSSLPELMRDFSTYRMLAYSVVLVLVMLFRPGGIFGRWEFSLTRLLDGIRHPRQSREGA